MALITWNESLSVDIAEIDRQHQCLIELVNRLHEAMKAGQGNSIIEAVLSDLLSYTIFHFGTEEKYFRQYNYPEFLRHKMEHDELTRKARDLSASLAQGKLTITVDVMNFLKDWLNAHILGSDKKYGTFLRSRGVN